MGDCSSAPRHCDLGDALHGFTRGCGQFQELGPEPLGTWASFRRQVPGRLAFLHVGLDFSVETSWSEGRCLHQVVLSSGPGLLRWSLTTPPALRAYLCPEEAWAHH